MKILDNIISDKKIEIETLSKIVSISNLEKQKDFTKQCKSLKESIKKSKGLYVSLKENPLQMKR